MTLNPDHPTTSDGGTQETAKQEAGRLGTDAQDAARDVAGTAKDEALHLKDEAAVQARGLAASAQEEVTSQLSTQKDRLAAQSRGISEDLERISRGERPESDLVNQAVSMLSQRARRVTEQLESKEPMDLLDDVRRFAARRPGTFLAIAAGIGLLAGRLTRGLKDAHDDDTESARTRGATAPGPGPAGRVPGTVYPGDTGYTGGAAGQVPAPPTVPPTVTGPDVGTGAPGVDEILGTPAAQRPYDAGRPDAGGRP